MPSAGRRLGQPHNQLCLQKAHGERHGEKALLFKISDVGAIVISISAQIPVALIVLPVPGPPHRWNVCTIRGGTADLETLRCRQPLREAVGFQVVPVCVHVRVTGSHLVDKVAAVVASIKNLISI